MTTRTLIPVEEYLTTVYRPDCDYVDGAVLERNFGEKDHGRLQLKLARISLRVSRNGTPMQSFEQRVQVRPGRFRIPDVCVLLGETDEQVLTTPPFLCVEVLSPEDRMSLVQDRIDDYFAMGVPNVWVVDPARRCAFEATAAGDLRRVTEALRTTDPSFEVPLSEIFE